MLRRVKIKALPKARTGYQVQGALANDVPAMGGADYDAYIGMKFPKVNNTLTAVPRSKANLEAEGGETVVGNIDGSGMPSKYMIKGPRHTNGGVPLNLPDDSFIFSDTKDMKIADPIILKMFNKPVKKGGYTPAELSKPYDLNKYRMILQDPDSDVIARKTAELMIKTYTLKLGALALAQEGKKGFPQGIPAIAQPYMEANNITEEQVMPELAAQKREQEEMMMQQQQMMQQQMGNEAPIEPYAQEEQAVMDPGMSPDQMPMQQYGGTSGVMSQDTMMYDMGGYDMPFFDYNPDSMKYGGSTLDRYQDGGNTPTSESQLTDADKKIIKDKWAGDTQAYLDFIETKKALTENDALLDEMVRQFDSVIEDKAYYTKGNEKLYTGYKPELKKMSKNKQEILNQLLAQEERNARLAAHGLDPATTGQSPAKGQATNAKTLEFIKNNPGLSDLKFDAGYKGQAAYIAYRKALDKPEFKSFAQFQEGVGDETIAGVRGKISGIDNKSTDTTLGQRVGYQKNKKPKGCPCVDPVTKETYYVGRDEYGNCLPCTKKIEKCVCTRKDGSTYDPGKNADGSCKDCDSTEEAAAKPPVTDPQFWLQDTINTMGAFGDLARVKKYMPWGARLDLEEPRPTFMDPTRDLAAQSEQANIATQAAAQFSGPRSLNARAAGIQGQTAKGAANTLSAYNNANIPIANQFEDKQVAIRNQENMYNQQLANTLYDKNVINNQQFDNAMTQGRTNLRQAYNTALTNKWKTDALNQMYPDYQTMPGVGGRVVYRPTEKKANPLRPDPTAGEYLKDLMAQGFSRESAEKIVMKQYYSKEGGSTGGYVYSDWPIFL